MIDEERELSPLKPEPAKLETMSVAALEDYIVGLEAEIVRAREVIAGKQDARTSADGFFTS